MWSGQAFVDPGIRMKMKILKSLQRGIVTRAQGPLWGADERRRNQGRHLHIPVTVWRSTHAEGDAVLMNLDKFKETDTLLVCPSCAEQLDTPRENCAVEAAGKLEVSSL